MAAGVLFVVPNLLILAEDPEDPIGSVTSASYAVSVGLALLAGVLLTGALVGLYVHQSEAAGTLGLVGFLLAFAGAVLASGSAWENAFILPVLARETPELLEAGPPGLVFFGEALSFGLLGVGWILFGLATYRARVYPGIPAVLLVAGGVLTLVPIPSLVLGVVVGIVLDVAVAWLGFALLTGRGAPAEQSSRVR